MFNPTKLLFFVIRTYLSREMEDVSNGTIADLLYTMPLIWAMQGMLSVCPWDHRTTSSGSRNYVTQDILRRILSDYFGYDIHFVMNITDIDDKVVIPSDAIFP
jgi:hypothetical protein